MSLGFTMINNKRSFSKISDLGWESFDLPNSENRARKLLYE